MIDYTYGSYRRLLDHIRACGHHIGPLSEMPASGRYVILRHDIDYSVIKALEMAEFEHALGIRATVYLMLASAYYNLLDPDNLRAARRIAALGHEIGFHYDTDVFDDAEPDAMAHRIARDAAFLADVVGAPVATVAQHNPSVTTTRVHVPGFIDAYDDRFCRDIAYVSDSRRLFGAADPWRFFAEQERCQLLIHPLWWHHVSLGRREAFAAVRAEVLARVDGRIEAMAASMEAHERRMRGHDV